MIRAAAFGVAMIALASCTERADPPEPKPTCAVYEDTVGFHSEWNPQHGIIYSHDEPSKQGGINYCQRVLTDDTPKKVWP